MIPEKHSMPFHYLYRLTYTDSTKKRYYYYGVRSCNCMPDQDMTYWSSSSIVRQLYKENPSAWKKKILKIHATREEALAHEVRLHNYFDVAHHPQFLNLANQTSTKFSYTDPTPEVLAARRAGILRSSQDPYWREQKRQGMCEVTQCPHCGKIAKRASLIGWHFDRCSLAPSNVRKSRSIPPQLLKRQEELRKHARDQVQCPYCEKKGAWSALQRYHFKNCLQNPEVIARPPLEVLTCPHCGKTGRGNVMKQWHFARCLKNPRKLPPLHKHQQQAYVCPYCGKKGYTKAAMMRWHFENCKKKPKN